VFIIHVKKLILDIFSFITFAALWFLYAGNLISFSSPSLVDFGIGRYRQETFFALRKTSSLRSKCGRLDILICRIFVSYCIEVDVFSLRLVKIFLV
jgi:hypothetical protein